MIYLNLVSLTCIKIDIKKDLGVFGSIFIIFGASMHLYIIPYVYKIVVQKK